MMSNYRTHETVWDKIWRDKNGNVVIFQFPNAWLLAWVTLSIITLFVPHGTGLDILYMTTIVILGIWSMLEILKGVNYFRRALGVILMAFTILSFASVVN